MITVGTPARRASSTGRTRATLSSGASTMPWTPWLKNPSTTWTCCSRSSSRSGPFQMIVTGCPCADSSREAWTAPAWMLLQNSCVVPLGITAIVRPLAREPDLLQAAMQSAVARTARACFIALPPRAADVNHLGTVHAHHQRKLDVRGPRGSGDQRDGVARDRHVGEPVRQPRADSA